MAVNSDRFNFVYSCDLDDVNFRVKIASLEGSFPKPDYKQVINNPLIKHSGLFQQEKADLIVLCQLFSDGKFQSPVKQTSYKHFTNRWNWNEWLYFPFKISELSRDAQLVFKILDSFGPGESRVVGMSSISIFGKYGAMRKEIYDLKTYPEQEQIVSGKCNKHDVVYQINKLKKQYQSGYMPKVDWLDKLTFREIERITQEEKNRSEFLFLSVEFPKIHIDGIEYTVVYFERNAEENCKLCFESDLITIADPEMYLENLVESKHHKLSRSVRSGVTDRDLKPNAHTRDQLNLIVSYSTTKVLSSEEQDLIWKFRFYLMSQKKALTKFLKCVKWDMALEAKQAIDLLFKWEPMDIEDALELLSPQFQHPLVRTYAVSRLKEAPNEDLQLYLLQLVQALKYEDFEKIRVGFQQAQQNSETTGEKDKTKDKENSSHASKDIVSKSSGTGDVEADKPKDSNEKKPDATDHAPKAESMDLATFLIEQACSDEIFANYFFWYLMVECEDAQSSVKSTVRDARTNELYMTVMKRFSQKLDSSKALERTKNTLLRQKKFVKSMVQLMKKVAGEKGGQAKKMEKLLSFLNENDAFKYNFSAQEPLTLPLDPEVKVTGIVFEKTTLFKSALNPIKLTFTTANSSEYVAIVKHGDDLRQDQLILQTITLMDKLLRKENLDLKLTPYRVLATSTKDGFVQYVDSIPVAEILKNYDIQKYFRIHSPCEHAPYGISPDVMDTYIKSCAGYCIITYLLGVGDRHFDNLMLTKNGNLFHIDFGYILGRDPKPFPPPMKLSKEMVEAMGGIGSEHYQQFRKLCYTAFLHLRRHSNLILNLFNLMIDADIPDIALEPDKTVKKVQDKFRLDLNDEEAVHYIQGLIDVSVTAVMAVLVEQIHKFAQYWRK